MKRLIIFLFGWVFTFSTFSQWSRTSGPEGISIESLACINDTIYAGTATDGLYASTDDGISWFPLNSGIETEDVRAIDNLPGYLLIGTFGKGVFRSTNGGQTWLPPANGNDIYVKDIVVKDSYIFAGTNSDGVYRSSDNGETWEQLFGIFGILSMGVSENKIFAATSGFTRFSTDNGETWTDVNGLSGAFPWSFYTSGDTIIVGGVNEVYRSTDEGNTFTQIPLGFSFSIVNVHSIISIGSTLFMGTSYDGVYKSIDFGSNWFAANEGMGPKDVRAVIATGSSTLIAGSHYVGVFRSTNLGDEWSKSMSGFPAGMSISTMLSAEAGVFAGTSDGVYRTTDNGATWLELDGANDTINYSLVRGLCEKNGVIFASTVLQFNATVYKSTDNGLTWARSGSGLPGDLTFINGLATSGNNIVAATSEGVYYSSNDGNSWYQANIPVENIEDIAASGGYAYAIVGFIGIYRSVDEGINWSPVLPSTIDYICLAAYNNYAYAGSIDQGLRYSTDFGSSWQSSSGFPFETTIFGIGPVGDGMVLAAKFMPDYIYVSYNNGSYFSPYSEGLGRWANTEAFAVTDSFMFAGTDYNGVWRRLRTGVVSVNTQNDLPQVFHLAQNFPNPFNPSTTIEYSIPGSGNVKLVVYNSLGEEVETLVNDFKEAGIYKIYFNAGELSSGIYFYKLETGYFYQVHKMILLR